MLRRPNASRPIQTRRKDQEMISDIKNNQTQTKRFLFVYLLIIGAGLLFMSEIIGVSKPIDKSAKVSKHHTKVGLRKGKIKIACAGDSLTLGSIGTEPG